MIIRFEMHGYEVEATVEPEDRSVGLRADVLEMQITDEGVGGEPEDLEPWIRLSIEEGARKLAGRTT